MDNSFSFGGLIPLWILGAPFLAALFSLATMPKRSHRDERNERDMRRTQAPYGASSAAGLSPQGT